MLISIVVTADSVSTSMYYVCVQKTVVTSLNVCVHILLSAIESWFFSTMWINNKSFSYLWIIFVLVIVSFDESF